MPTFHGRLVRRRHSLRSRSRDLRITSRKQTRNREATPVPPPRCERRLAILGLFPVDRARNPRNNPPVPALTDFNIGSLETQLQQWGVRASHARRLLGAFYRNAG